MTERQLRKIRRWWGSYVRRYDAGDADLRRNMRLKESHTRRVCREASVIGRSLNLTPGEQRIAETVVLLHDVGRFAQYARYRTFADGKSENHALLGLKILRKDEVLGHLPARLQSLIRRAIRYHNRAEIPAVKDRQLLFFARLLRDADKLDILRVAIGYYRASPGRKNHAVAMGLPDVAGVTKGVMKDLRAKRIVASKNVKNQNDLKLLLLGWVFDLNFLPALLAVKRRAYLERIRDALPENACRNEAYAIVLEYVDRRLAGEG